MANGDKPVPIAPGTKGPAARMAEALRFLSEEPRGRSGLNVRSVRQREGAHLRTVAE